MKTKSYNEDKVIKTILDKISLIYSHELSCKMLSKKDDNIEMCNNNIQFFEPEQTKNHEEEFTFTNLLCDDYHYEICSINNIDNKYTNDNKIINEFKPTNEIKLNVYYDDETKGYDINEQLINDIKQYASKIKCKDFYGKGTIDDYSELFKAVSNIANDYKEIELDIGSEEFNEFSKTTEEMINLFETFSTKLHNINVINDTNFLITISNALEKMCKLSESFIKFKKTILSVSDTKITKNMCETTQILSNVMVDITCAINYISHFVNPTDSSLINSELKIDEKNDIKKAVNIINNLNVNYNSSKNKMENDENIKDIMNYSKSIKNSSKVLKKASEIFKNKINSYNFE